MVYHYHAAVHFLAVYENYSLDGNPTVAREKEFQSYLEKLADDELAKKVDSFLVGAGLNDAEKRAIIILDGLRDGNWLKPSASLDNLFAREFTSLANHSSLSIRAREKLDAYARGLRNKQKNKIGNKH